MSISALVLTTISRIPMDGVKQPEVDWTVIGGPALLTLTGIVFTGVLGASVIAGLIGIGMMIFGKITRHSNAFSAGLATLAWAVIGAVLSGSIAAIINWSIANIKV